MNCTDFLSQLTDYFDGQVPPELLEEVRAHLAECQHCTVVLNTTRHRWSVFPLMLCFSSFCCRQARGRARDRRRCLS